MGSEYSCVARVLRWQMRLRVRACARATIAKGAVIRARGEGGESRRKYRRVGSEAGGAPGEGAQEGREYRME